METNNDLKIEIEEFEDQSSQPDILVVPIPSKTTRNIKDHNFQSHTGLSQNDNKSTLNPFNSKLRIHSSKIGDDGSS